jgi:hypothetical protein
MTYSIAVILMETSNSINLFVPLTFSILISNRVGEIFTRGLYLRATRAKQMPIIVEGVPLACKEIVAGNIMSKDVLTFDCVESMEKIEDALLNTDYHMFPVVNNKGLVIGTIPRNYIIVLIKFECFYNPSGKSFIECMKESKDNRKAKKSHVEKDKSSFGRQ